MRRHFGEKAIIALLWVQFAAALGFLGMQLISGPWTLTAPLTEIFGVNVTIGWRFDPLSTTVFAMVSLLGAVTGQYALRYLDGDPQQWQFYQSLLLTVTAVTLLILASNLLMFVAAWLAISWGLHRLLVLRPDRPAAVSAARKNFLISRLGDAAIWVALVLIYFLFGTFEFSDLFARVEPFGNEASARDHALLNFAAVLFAIGAMTKSVQIPFHTWLSETMETPTPVSAFMHAGIINAGGFLVLRLSPIITHAQLASAMLATFGALTAVYGSLVMATQNNIKTKLAYSTISQMGMMMFACGIHAYTFALFHLIAHSLYKAHAFLSTASIVEERRGAAAPLAPLTVPGTLLIVAAASALVVFGQWWQGGEHLPSLTYVAVLLIGLSQVAGAHRQKSAHNTQWGLQVVALLIGALIVFATIETLLGQFVKTDATYAPNIFINYFAFSIFVVGLALARFIIGQRTPLARKVYMWLWNDAYLSVMSTRLLDRVWPTR